MTTLADYSVLITGASEGLGRGIALAAAGAGAAVAVTALDAAQAQTVADESRRAADAPSLCLAM